jgi:hypothetical protein
LTKHFAQLNDRTQFVHDCTDYPNSEW